MQTRGGCTVDSTYTDPDDGVVTLNQIERNSPIAANADAWDFNDLTCSSIAEIRLIAFNVTTPCRELVAKGVFK
jgi:hypothetical protein